MTALPMPSNYVCSPTADEPTHHAVLWDDVGNSLGLVAVVASGNGYDQNIRGLDVQPANQLSFRQTNSPGTGYSDFERPYSYDEQVTWNNGRGEPYQTATPSTFYDSLNVWTLNANQVVNGPLPTYAKGYRNHDINMPGSVVWSPTHTKYKWAKSFSASASYNADKAYFLLRRVGVPTSSCVMTLCSDNAGVPGTVLQTVTLTAANITTDFLAVWPKFDWSGTQALVSGTTYWLVLTFSATPDTTNYWYVGTANDTAGYSSINGGTNWVADKSLFYRVTDADVLRKWHFFEYKGLLYAATEPENAGTAPQIFRNGWRGDADSNSGDKTKLNDATQMGWNATNILSGVAKIWAGPGYDDDPNFRTITAGASGVATVDTAWYTAHTTSTQYVIKGTDWWTEITGHGIGVPIRSVVAPADVIYFALGNGTTMVRWGEYDNFGAWATRAWTNDGTNKADILSVRTDQRDGVQVVMGSNSDRGGGVSVARANVKAWGDNLQFGTPTPLGQDKYHINGIADGDKFIFVSTDAAVYAIDKDTMDKVIDFQAFTGPDNGKAMFFSSPYTYFSLGRGGFERLNGTNMEDIGLWRLEGWPANRQGPVAHGVGHPQYGFVAVDAGPSGYSAVYVWNGGWHEIFRATEAGQRIRSLYYEVIPGSAVDRLWIGMDADIVWLAMPNVLNPYFDSSFRYTYESSITSAWIIDQARDMWKYIKNMKIFAEGLSTNTRWIEWDYQTDSETDSSAWHVGTGTFATSPSTEITVALKAKRFRYRLRMYTTDNTTSLRMIANTIGLISGIPPKKMVNMTFRVREQDGSTIDLNGDPDGLTYASIVSTLKTWESDPSPVHMASIDYDADSIDVMVQPSPRRPLAIIAGESTDIVGTIKMMEA